MLIWPGASLLCCFTLIYFIMTQKWYEVARSRDNRFLKKMDVFIYLSTTYDNAFELLYVSFDQFNRSLTRCYHGKFVIKKKGDYIVIRHGLCRKRLVILDYDGQAGLVAIANRRKTRASILSKSLPFDKNSFERMKNDIEKQGFEMMTAEIYS